MTIVVGRCSGSHDLDRLYDARNAFHATYANEDAHRVWCSTSHQDAGLMLVDVPDSMDAKAEHKLWSDRITDWFKSHP